MSFYCLFNLLVVSIYTKTLFYIKYEETQIGKLLDYFGLFKELYYYIILDWIEMGFNSLQYFLYIRNENFRY